MKSSFSPGLGLLPLLAASVAFSAADAVRDSAPATAQPDIAAAPTMHGLPVEEIDYAADGGLYAELVENRSFEHADPRNRWSDVVRGEAAGSATIIRESPIHANNPTAVRIAVTQAGSGRTRGVGLANDGFGGFAVRAGEAYRFSVYTRLMAGRSMPLRITLEGAGGAVLGELELEATATGSTTKWQRIDAPIVATATDPAARLVVVAQGAGTVDLDMISLFPQATFKGRRNGLRADLAEALADRKPGYLRFPGGGVAGDFSCANAIRWKDTIGDVAERKGYASPGRCGRLPRDLQTSGFGFFEFLLLCEDIGAKPVAVVSCGPCAPGAESRDWVQDTLDLVEFANGPATSGWGAKRAQMGHPEPFNLKYLALGNESQGPPIAECTRALHVALKAKFPDLQIIGCSGLCVDEAR